MGIYKRHSAEPREKSGPDQVGGSDRRGFPLSQIRSGGTVMGKEEE